jgi:hypothetical protein
VQIGAGTPIENDEGHITDDHGIERHTLALDYLLNAALNESDVNPKGTSFILFL